MDEGKKFTRGDNPGTIRTTEQAKRMGSIGGKKSAETRRANAEMRKGIEILLKMKATGKVADSLELMGYKKGERTNLNALLATAYSMAIKGNTKALELLMQYVLQIDESERKRAESDARIDVMRGNGAVVSSSDDEDGDVVIYLPQIEKEDGETEAENKP